MSNLQVIPRKSRWGLLAYRLPNGLLFADEDGNPLVVSVHLDREHDTQVRAQRLIDAASYYGAESGGDLVFLPGVRKVSEYEHDDQMEALIDEKAIPGDWHDDDMPDIA